MKNKNKESSTNKLRAKKVLAIALSGVALTGCGSKTRGHEASTTNRDKPVATEVQQKTNATTVQQETITSKSAEVKEFSGEVTGHPVDIEVIPEGNNDFEIRLSNPNNQTASMFGVGVSRGDKFGAPLEPTFTTPGFKIVEYETGPLVMIPGLGAGNSISFGVDFPDNSDGRVFVETYPQVPEGMVPGSHDYVQLQAEKMYPEE